MVDAITSIGHMLIMFVVEMGHFLVKQAERFYFLEKEKNKGLFSRSTKKLWL